jgi:hypothetical protein
MLQRNNSIGKEMTWSELWGTSSKLYHRVDKLLRELANPNLHDIPTNLPFRVEQ